MSPNASAAAAAAPPSAIVDETGGGVNLLGLGVLDGALVVVASVVVCLEPADGLEMPDLLLVEPLLPADEAEDVLCVREVDFGTVPVAAPVAVPLGVALRDRVVAGVAELGSLGFGYFLAGGGGGLNSESLEVFSSESLMNHTSTSFVYNFKHTFCCC